MFILKKCIVSFLVPPGFVIIILLATGIWLWWRPMRRCAMINIALAGLFWGLSVNPVSDALMHMLESGLTIPRHIQGDVIILLGGGINEGVPDLTGSGTPNKDTLARMVTAVRLHRQLDVPILVSGGSGFAGRSPEAPVVRRFLVDLGVNDSRVLLETRSRDTLENALYCREILRQHGFRHPLLVTSAYHMRRSIQAFQKAGVPVTPVPVQFATDGVLPAVTTDYLPSPGALNNSATALREYFGLLFYWLTR